MGTARPLTDNEGSAPLVRASRAAISSRLYDGPMTLRIRNTLTRSVEPVEPLEPGRVRMYTCGPTVYRFAHVGNLRVEPAGRPHPARPPLPRPRGLPRQEHHRRGSPARGPVRSRRGPDARPGRASSTRRPPRSPTPTRLRSTPTRRSSTSCRRTSSRARPSTSPRWSSSPRRSRTAGMAYATDARNVYYAVGVVRRATAGLSGNSLDDLRAGHRGEVEPDKRDPADFALWKAAGRRRSLKWPTDPLGRWLPRLAPGMLGDGPPLPRRPVRPAHRRHRQHLPAPRGRDRPVGAAGRRAAGAHLGPRRAPADGGPQDGQVGRQLPAGDRARRRGHRPPRVPLPRPDLALRAQARTTRTTSIAAAAAALASLRARLAALGPPPASGPWAAPPVLAAGAAGDRPEGTATGLAGFGGGDAT